MGKTVVGLTKNQRKVAQIISGTNEGTSLH